MTDRHARLILSIEHLTATQIAVLVWLALFADEKGYASPGIALLQRASGLKRRALYYALKELEALKVITRSKGTPKTDYKTLYFMAFAAEEPVTQPLAKPRKATSAVNAPNFWEEVKQEREKQKNGTPRTTHARRPR